MKKTPVPNSRPDLSMFICYSRVNMAEKHRLITHLKPMTKRLNVELWHDEKITLGSKWRKAIEEKLAGMNIFLFLVSADSLASEFIDQVEYIKALEESQKGKVELIPILIQPCDWGVNDDLNSFQCLPRNAIPVASWPKPEEGYAEVSTELRKHIEAKYVHSEQAQITKTAETQEKQLSSINDVSPINEETMYRESWTSKPLTNAGPLPLQKLIKSVKEVRQFRSNLSKLDSNLAGFKPDLSQLLNQIGSFLKELEDALKESGNEGHRVFRLVLETKSKVSEIRKQLLIANTHSQKGLQALANLANRDLIYFDSALEQLENSMKTILKDDFGMKPN